MREFQVGDRVRLLDVPIYHSFVGHVGIVRAVLVGIPYPVEVELATGSRLTLEHHELEWVPETAEEQITAKIATLSSLQAATPSEQVKGMIQGLHAALALINEEKLPEDDRWELHRIDTGGEW